MGGMAGGAGRGFGQSLVNTGVRFGGQAPAQQSNVPSAGFTPVTPNVYTPAFSSNQQAQMPVMSPAQQAQQAGLQALMANMMAQYGQVPGALAMTQQRPQMQMPRFSAPALAYRPNMAPAQTSLGRVAVSVAEQQRRAAQAELDKLKAEQETKQITSSSGDYSGG